MKTNRLLSVALALVTLTLFSCTRAEQEVAPAVKSCPEVRTFTCKIGPGVEDTRISIDGEGITRWKAGDRILVHGEYIGEVDGKQYSTVVTLTEGDISADGKTATISVTTDPAGLAGIVPYVHSKSGVQDYSSTLYAAYPAEAVTEGPLHSYYHTVFAETNHPLMIAYDDHADGDVFVFTQAGSVLSFKLPSSLDYTSYVFYGNDEEEVGYGRWTAKTARKTSGEISNYFPYTGGDVADPVSLPQTEISGPVVCDGQTLNRICLPGKKVSFPHGFTIAFLRGEERVMQVAVKSSVEMNRGEYLPLGDVSGHLKPYVHKSSIPKKDAVDLGEDGTANCYILEPGSASGAIYKFPAVKGNSTAAVSGIERVDVLWETWNNAEAVQPHSVVAEADFEDGYIYFRMPLIPDGGSRRSGNAVIAAKDGDGAVLWSWHIWVPETAVGTLSCNLSDKGLMDRNLGALVAADGTAAAAVESFGLLYQWGRKDPFTGAGAVGGEDGATVAGESFTVAAGTISLTQAVRQPTLLGHSENGDWLSTADNTLWSDDAKTIYDPCPAGYRVPACDQDQPMWSGDLSAVSGWGTNVSQYWFRMGSPAVFFPLAGYRDDYAVGSLSYAGDRAVLWSASNSGDAKGSVLHVRPSSSSFINGRGTTAKSRGASVRCVTEEGAPASQTLCEDAYLGIRPMVMAYVTEYTKKSTLSAEYLTHINYCHGRFVNPETGDGGITIVSDNISIEDVVALKSAKPGLKVLLMIGGWGGKADGFSEMARDPDKRTEFCQSCKAHVDHYGLDGIDIDWEYPTVSADNETGASPEDTQNFNLVLRELRQTLGTKKIISVASSSNASYIDWSFARDYVDYVNVMSYDMGNPPYHNSTLYRSSLTKSLSCEESVEKHRIAGMPLKRQNLGVPFYGHGKSPYKSDVKYNEMASILGATSGTYAGYNVYHWDDVAKVPYLTDASGNIYLCYDNPESVAWKGRFAREKDMMGVMVWEYRHDDAEFSMLKALYNAVYPE